MKKTNLKTLAFGSNRTVYARSNGSLFFIFEGTRFDVSRERCREKLEAWKIIDEKGKVIHFVHTEHEAKVWCARTEWTYERLP